MSKICTLFMIFVATSLASFLHAQDLEYLETIKQANREKSDSNFTWAVQLYEDAFDNNEGFIFDHFSLIHSYIYSRQYGKAKNQLMYLVDKGVTMPTIEFKYWIYDDFMDSEEWKSFEHDYSYLRKKFLERVDVDLILELGAMHADQVMIMSLQNSNDTNVQKRIEFIENRNIDRLRNMVHKNAWPSVQKVGVEASGAAWMILVQNSMNGVRDSVEWKYFEPIILHEVKQGSIHPVLYVSWVDKYLQSADLPQRYGTNNPKKSFSPIEDIEAVDELRKQMGLSTLADFAIKTGRELPPNYFKNK